MFLDLRELGYEGSYDSVAAFGRRWKVGQMERVKSASKLTTFVLYLTIFSTLVELSMEKSSSIWSQLTLKHL